MNRFFMMGTLVENDLISFFKKKLCEDKPAPLDTGRKLNVHIYIYIYIYAYINKNRSRDAPDLTFKFFVEIRKFGES